MATTSRSINSTVALAFGAIYTVVGLLGFFVSGDVPAAGSQGASLLGFDVNILHNIVHLLIGVALIGASRTTASARGANLTIGVVYIALGVLGPFIDDTVVDVVSLNGADHVLHLASGAALVAVALLLDKRGTVRA